MLAKRPAETPPRPQDSERRTEQVAKPKDEWMRTTYPKAADRLPVYSTVSDMDVEPLYRPG